MAPSTMNTFGTSVSCLLRLPKSREMASAMAPFPREEGTLELLE